jgi:hypothetical protein
LSALVGQPGIGAFGLDFWQNAHDIDTLQGSLNGFVSCSSSYTAVWNNQSAPKSSSAWGPVGSSMLSEWRFLSLKPSIQAAQMAACGAPQAPMVFLTAWTGLFLVALGFAGVYAAFTVRTTEKQADVRVLLFRKRVPSRQLHSTSK